MYTIHVLLSKLLQIHAYPSMSSLVSQMNDTVKLIKLFYFVHLTILSICITRLATRNRVQILYNNEECRNREYAFVCMSGLTNIIT